MAKIGRPKGSRGKNKKIVRAKAKNLRLNFYGDVPSSMGGSVSGIADQYGRILEEYINSMGQLDLRPTGHCVAAKH